MFTSVNDFLNEWNQEAAFTQKVLDVLADESLNQEVSPGLYSIGSLAWLGTLLEQLTTFLHRLD